MIEFLVGMVAGAVVWHYRAIVVDRVNAWWADRH